MYLLVLLVLLVLKMLTCGLKKNTVKKNIVTIILEDGINEKITILVKLCLVHFSSFQKKIEFNTNPCTRKNAKTNTHFLMQRFLFHSKLCNRT